ncbi:MAG: hypothetical protein IJ323_03960 [Clostridia bacterium]|nr:hypothetical protein [Clostridia bacterium]
MANNKIMRFVVTAVVLVALMTLTAFAADITGGFGAIGGVDDTYYAAPATLNAAGNGLDLGEAIQLTTANNTGLAGLYAVSTDSTFAGDYEIVYVYGAMADRKDFLERNTWTTSGNKTGKDADANGFDDTYTSNAIKTVGTKTYVVGTDEDGDGFDDNNPTIRVVWSANNGDGFYYLANYQGLRMDAKNSTTYSFAPGYITGKGVNASFWGTWGTYYTGVTGSWTNSRNISTALLSGFKNATDDTKEAAFDAIVEYVDEFNYSYALTEKEIIPVSEVNSYTYKLVVFKDDNGFTNSDHEVKFEAYVADKEGKITVYTYVHSAIELSKTASTLVVDFGEGTNGKWENNKVPTEGYFVGFKIWPFYGLTDYTKFTVPTAAATNVGHVHVVNGYSIDTPKASKPTGLGIGANGAITGTIAGMTYEYAAVSSADMLNGTALTYTTVDDTTALTDAGLYAVRVVGVDGEYDASDFAILYIAGTTEQKVTLPNKNEDDRAVFSATSSWVDGTMTEGNNSAMFGSPYQVFQGSYDTGFTTSNYYLTSHKHIDASYVTAVENATEETKADALENIAKLAKAISYKYAYDPEEIIEVKEFSSLSYKLFIRQGYRYVLPDRTKSEVRLYVMDEAGTVKPYSAKPTVDIAKLYTWMGYSIPVSATDFVNLPTTGYVIGFEIIPYAEFDAQAATINTEEDNNNICYGFCMDYDNDMYSIKTAQTTPVLAVETGANKTLAELTISNFVTGTTYAYSTDEGATWTEFTTATLKFTEANKYYWVKALGDATHFDSEIAVPTYPSAAVIYKGASLVLDGQIGIRIYFDVDKAALGYTMIKHTIANGVDSVEYAKDIKAVNYEADGRTAYVTAYVAPKDFDNATITVNQLLVNNSIVGISGSIINSIPVHTVSDYITVFYKQVEAGNEECIAANDLVLALEAYCKNADAYFNTDAEALDTVAADTTAISTIADPTKAGKFTYNGNTILEHYSTSLILEENVTIRHYFKATAVTGQPTFTTETVTATEASGKAVAFNPENYLASAVDGQGYYYVDITGIDAKNLDTQYELTLTLGEESIVVKYSALNYVKQAYSDADDKLANLVKAIYNYSVEAEEYAN